MKEAMIGTRKVVFYDSIEDIVIDRYHKYNKMVLIDSGIGSDLNDIDTHIERAMTFVKTNPELVVSELKNLRQNVFFVQNELSPKFLSFAALIKSIDGVECNDLSDDALMKIHNEIKELPLKDITDCLESVKKKVDNELQLYFPNQFNDAGIKEYFDVLKKYTMLKLDSIIAGITDEIEEQINKISEYLITYTKPYIFYGPESIEIEYDKQFENMCLLLSQKLNVNPKKFTVLEFYNAFEYLKKQLKTK